MAQKAVLHQIISGLSPRRDWILATALQMSQPQPPAPAPIAAPATISASAPLAVGFTQAQRVVLNAQCSVYQGIMTGVAPSSTTTPKKKVTRRLSDKTMLGLSLARKDHPEAAVDNSNDKNNNEKDEERVESVEERRRKVAMLDSEIDKLAQSLAVALKSSLADALVNNNNRNNKEEDKELGDARVVATTVDECVTSVSTEDNILNNGYKNTDTNSTTNDNLLGELLRVKQLRLLGLQRNARRRFLADVLGADEHDDDGKHNHSNKHGNKRHAGVEERQEDEELYPHVRGWRRWQRRAAGPAAQRHVGVKRTLKQDLKRQDERSRRRRDRQKAFFKAVEQQVEVVFEGARQRRERARAVTKAVRDYHRKIVSNRERATKERAERERKERIEALKENDVEGYLRLLNDLLKQTDEYLQRLGDKLAQVKGLARDIGDCDADIDADADADADMNNKDKEKDEVKDENNDAPGNNKPALSAAEHYRRTHENYYRRAHSVDELSNVRQPATMGSTTLTMRSYQLQGLAWLLSLQRNRLNGILADEMGTGKTIQVIALICHLVEASDPSSSGPFLVAAPSSVVPSWLGELSRWAPSLTVAAYRGSPAERKRVWEERVREERGRAEVVVTTYELLMGKKDRKRLSKVPWRYLIIDEGHRLKNSGCRLSRDLSKYYTSQHRLLLTGTPLQNRMEELWSLLHFLLPSVFESAGEFSKWFENPFEEGCETLNEEEELLLISRLHAVLRPLMLRRLKEHVETDLPTKTQHLLRAQPSAYQRELARRVKLRLREKLGGDGGASNSTSKQPRAIHNTVMELRNVANHPFISCLHNDEVEELLKVMHPSLPPLVRACGKLELLDRVLPKLLATGHKVLLFCTMTRALDLLEEYLHWKGIKCLRLDGATAGDERGPMVARFNAVSTSAGDDVPESVFLLSIRAGGVGLNLQAADTIDLQAQARAHRIGQTRDVLIRARAERKLAVADKSITAGFFDNHTSAKERQEYLEALLRDANADGSALGAGDVGAEGVRGTALNRLISRGREEFEAYEPKEKPKKKANPPKPGAPPRKRGRPPKQKPVEVIEVASDEPPSKRVCVDQVGASQEPEGSQLGVGAGEVREKVEGGELVEAVLPARTASQAEEKAICMENGVPAGDEKSSVSVSPEATTPLVLAFEEDEEDAEKIEAKAAEHSEKPEGQEANLEALPANSRLPQVEVEGKPEAVSDRCEAQDEEGAHATPPCVKRPRFSLNLASGESSLDSRAMGVVDLTVSTHLGQCNGTPVSAITSRSALASASPALTSSKPVPEFIARLNAVLSTGGSSNKQK
eukprot:jgi/Chlat1/6402/Chrsp45S06022